METDDFIPKYSESYRSILIFGPPGSGKGTLSKFLSGAGNHFHLSSGDVFRKLSPESPAGQLYHRYASKGLLLPDEVTIKIWHHYVSGLIATNCYFPNQQLLLLDGIPRTMHQADLLDRYVKVEYIIVLDMPNVDRLIKRMQRRAIIEKRMDDMDPDILKKRMEIYQKDTTKLLERYPKNIQSIFDADQKPLEVLRDVLIKLTHIL